MQLLIRNQRDENSGIPFCLSGQELFAGEQFFIKIIELQIGTSERWQRVLERTYGVGAHHFSVVNKR